jgi:hypothetical protein
MAEPSGAFAVAYDTVSEVEDIVEQRIRESADAATRYQETALGTIEALGAVNFDFSAGEIPAPPNIDPSIDIDMNLPAIVPTSFGSITSQVPDVPSLEPVPSIPTFTIPEFVSSISSLTIPTPPAWTAPQDPPVEPTLDDVPLPDAPIIAMPAVPVLVDITVPDFEGLNLPYFDATAPEFVGTALPGILQWTEPTYHPEIIDEVLDVIRRLWSGGSGIPAAVEQAMFERASDREDLAAAREIDSVADEFSLRGFTSPSGLQAARVDQLRESLSIKKLGLNRELTIQIAQWQVENVRFACQQAIAAENVYVNLFLNAAQRMFEAARFQIESQISIYNAQVALYNAKMQGYGISAQVYKIQVEAEMSKIEVYKAEIEAELAKGQLNVQKVQIYSAQVEALNTQIEMYKAEMQGAQIAMQTQATRIEAYKASVSAYGEQIAAQKTKFDAYESQVKGEAAKAGIIDAEARAYSSLISGKSAIADIGVKIADVTIQKNRNLIAAYTAGLDAEKTRIQSQLSVIQSGAQAYIADTQRFAAQAQAEGTKAQVTVSAKEAELRTNVSFYAAQVQAYISNMEQMIRKAALVVDSLKAAGSISSTLAAGAMAGVHVGATLSGGGSVNASASETNSVSNSTSNNRSENYNYEGT